MFQYTPLILPLIVSAVVVATVVVYAWRYRTRTAALAFVATMLTLLIWTAGFVLEILSVGLRAKIFWANIQFIGITFLSLAWLMMVLDYTGHTGFKRFLPFLAVIPIITNILIWTNPYHHLFRIHPTLDTTSGPFPILVNDYGAWFRWVYSPSSYLVFFATLILLVRSFVFSTRAYRRQTVILLLATVLPLLTDLLYTVGVTPIPNFNLTPVVFSISGVLVGWAIFRFRFLDLMPIARSKLVDIMGDTIIVLDEKGRLVDLNPAAQTIFGDAFRDLIGQPIAAVWTDRQDLIDILMTDTALQAEISLGIGQDVRFYDLSLSLLYGRRRQIAGRLIMLRDITALKQAEGAVRSTNIQLQGANEQLADSNQALGAFAHTVAHDLKNPLSVLLGYAQLLEEQYAELSSETIDKIVHIIIKNGNKLTRIIDDLLLLASAREEKASLTPLDMRVVVASVLNNLAPMIEEYQAKVTVPDVWPNAIGYAPWIESVWTNYISNALKYGGRPPRVELGASTVSAPTTGTMTRFWVRDNGQGIPSQDRGKLFTSFMRLEQTRAMKGHGLGLSIIKRIVEKLGGQVGVESEGVPGKGSTFYFTLPLKADAAPRASSDDAHAATARMSQKDKK